VSERDTGTRVHGTVRPGQRPNPGGALFDFGNPEPWMQDALCAQVGGDLWHPKVGESASPAKRVCLECPVREACLDWALRTKEPFGILGGFSERERRRLKRGEQVRLKSRPEYVPQIRPCAFCNTDFRADWSTAVYCGRRCQKAAALERRAQRRRDVA
jgi:hypothetical protein